MRHKPPHSHCHVCNAVARKDCDGLCAVCRAPIGTIDDGQALDDPPAGSQRASLSRASLFRALK